MASPDSIAGASRPQGQTWSDQMPGWMDGLSNAFNTVSDAWTGLQNSNPTMAATGGGIAAFIVSLLLLKFADKHSGLLDKFVPGERGGFFHSMMKGAAILTAAGAVGLATNQYIAKPDSVLPTSQPAKIQQFKKEGQELTVPKAKDPMPDRERGATLTVPKEGPEPKMNPS